MISPLFGQAPQMLGASLGAGRQTGDLNLLYQIGGPRSAQVALKRVFWLRHEQNGAAQSACSILRNYTADEGGPLEPACRRLKPRSGAAP